MNRLRGRVHHSVIVAYVALFVALGGTGYAAISLPANSVGTGQIRNDAVTSNKIANGSIIPSKLNDRDVNGSIAMWARLGPHGTVLSSKPHAKIVAWNPTYHAGSITWGTTIPAGCFSLATVDGLWSEGFASVATLGGRHAPADVLVSTFDTSGQYAAEPVNVAVICP